MSGLEGQVVAVIGTGSARQRGVAVSAAEAGAAIALGTVDRSREQEFAVHSIANEVWTIGREHFVRVMDAAAATEITAFADEVWDRLGRCDVLVTVHEAPNDAPADELSADEWEACLAATLTGPFLAAQAFGRNMARQGGGTVLVLPPATEDIPSVAAAAALRALAEAFTAAWASRGVRVGVHEGEIAWA